MEWSFRKKNISLNNYDWNEEVGHSKKKLKPFCSKVNDVATLLLLNIPAKPNQPFPTEGRPCPHSQTKSMASTISLFLAAY